IQIDTALFETSFTSFRAVLGNGLSREQARALVEMAGIYKGDLLEGWSAEWCFYDRERYRRMYLAVLDKLADYFEGQHEYDAAVPYARLALKQDPARERAHRSVMRALAKSGDRSAALRQYERAVECLRDELGVDPEPETVVLERLIREGNVVGVVRERVSSN